MHRLARLLFGLSLYSSVVGQPGFIDLGLPNPLGKSSLQALSGDGGIGVGALEGKPISATTVDGNFALLSLGPYSGAFPRGISADGRIVVGETYDDPNDTPQNAALWRDGRLRVLGLEVGGYRARAYGVSADGRVAVGFANASTHTLQAARWVNGQVQPLGDISGSPNSPSEAHAANLKLQ